MIHLLAHGRAGTERDHDHPLIFIRIPQARQSVAMGRKSEMIPSPFLPGHERVEEVPEEGVEV